MNTELATWGYNANEVSLIESQVSPDITPEELSLFLNQARRSGLDPLSKQIIAVHRWSTRLKRKTMTIQVTIDGLRLIAERTGQYEGQTQPQWCGPDGKWVDVWLSNDPPAAARVGVWRTGFREPLYRVARWTAFAQADNKGNLTSFWAGMPDHMLAKCAESLALRGAFPQELAGLYTQEEMQQADEVEVQAKPMPAEIEYQDPAGETPSLTPEERDEIVVTLKSMLAHMCDDPDPMAEAFLEHYGVTTWDAMSDKNLGEAYDYVQDKFETVVESRALKAMHAKANEVAKLLGEEWDWDTARHKMVETATNGRTKSSKKLYRSEYDEIMQLLDDMLEEDEPFDG